MSEIPAPIALRFVNTGLGREADVVPTPHLFVSWLERELPDPDSRTGAGLAPVAPTLSLPDARRLFDEAMHLRRAFDEVLAATVDGRPPPSPALALLERTLCAGLWQRSVTEVEGRLALVTSPAASTDPLARLAPIAADLVAVVGSVDPGRLRRCAADDCGRWFADTSRGGQRRWCSMDTCGNRAKAARWRARHSDER